MSLCLKRNCHLLRVGEQKWFHYLLILFTNKIWHRGVSIRFLHPFPFRRAVRVPINMTVFYPSHISNRKLEMRKFEFSVGLKTVQMNFLLFAQLVFLWLTSMLAPKRSRPRSGEEDSPPVDEELGHLLCRAARGWGRVVWWLFHRCNNLIIQVHQEVLRQFPAEVRGELKQ